MKRSGFKPRKSTLPRRERMKPVNRKRRAKLFAVQYHSKERVTWVRSLPSVASGRLCCVNAHAAKTKGAGGTYKDIVPLTLAEEKEFHAVGRETFQRRHKLDLAAAAVRTEELWRAHSG